MRAQHGDCSSGEAGAHGSRGLTRADSPTGTRPGRMSNATEYDEEHKTRHITISVDPRLPIAIGTPFLAPREGR